MEAGTSSTAMYACRYAVDIPSSRHDSRRKDLVKCSHSNMWCKGKRISASLHHAGLSKSSSWPSLYGRVQTSRTIFPACRASGGGFSADEYGPYPWDPSWDLSDNEGIEWYQENIITLFTSEGLVQIGGTLVPHQTSNLQRKHSRRRPIKYRRYREEDYMDPKQGLCLGAIFDIVAHNGLDTGRRLCVLGFCRSIEMLSDAVEDTVLEQGGEVMITAKDSQGGLNEKLSMKVAVPLLWGVPPATESLNYAIRCGGGIVEKVFCQWEFL